MNQNHTCPHCGRELEGDELITGLCSSDDCPRHALYAAAPDLLAALQTARNVLAGLASGDLKKIAPDSPALNQARAAIARATGN